MLIAHGPLSVILTNLFFKKDVEKLTKFNKLLIFFFAFFIGILPDFDIFYLLAKHQPAFLHHSLITHTPIFWVIISLIIYLVLKLIFKSKDNNPSLLLSKIFLISTLSHIVADILQGYIKIFYPISNYHFTILGDILPLNTFAGHLGSPIFALEIIILSYFAYIFLKVFLEKFKNIGIVLLLFSSIYFVFNFFVYANTYQVITFQKANGAPIFDKDLDGLSDSQDYDNDNNFVDNFDQITKDDLLSKVEEILKKSKFVKSKRDLISNIVYFYGGLDSERIILQAYRELNSPLEPVINNYINTHSKENKDYAIYNYLFSKNTFKEIRDNDYKLQVNENELIPGSLIIVRRDYKYSLGIILINNEILYEDYDGSTKTVNFNYIVDLSSKIEKDFFNIFIQY